MTEIENTEQVNEDKQVLSFGEHLYIERKKQNLSVSDVAEAINLSEKIINAIEHSDISQLPQPAFVKGYLRAYAKFLEVSESLVLDEYAQAVPHNKETELMPRSPSPDDMSSNSPFVKMVTVSLLLIMILAVLYASFSYYKEAIVADNVELEGQALVSNEELAIDSDKSVEMDLSESAYDEYDAVPVYNEPADVVSDIEPQAGLDRGVEPKAEPEVAEAKADITTSELPLEVSEPVPSKKVQEDTAKLKPINQLVVSGNDSLEIFTTQASWVEVDDANSENLYYDLLQSGQQISLTGVAPFKVFLGNAPQVSIKLNGIPVNVERKYIRSNNIAHFNISVDQQQVIVH